MRVFVWGDPYLARLVKELFKNDEDICVIPTEREADVFYRIYVRWFFRNWGEMKRTYVQALRGKPVVFHWVGTDVLFGIKKARKLTKLGADPKNLVKGLLFDFLRGKFVHWTVAPWLGEELSAVGISSKVVPLVSPLVDASIVPLPEDFTVLAYLPDARSGFYGADVVYELAKLNPDVRFIIVATEQSPKDLPNVEARGWVDPPTMNEIYIQSSCLLRLVEHDGLPRMVLESLARGRYVIWSYAFPYVHQVRTLAQAQEALEQVKGETEPNVEGARYVHTEFSLEKVRWRIKKEFLGLT